MTELQRGAMDATQPRRYQEFLKEHEAFQQRCRLWHSSQRGFVAVLDGEVVDEDDDEFALAARIEADYPARFVLIRRLNEPSGLVERFESPESGRE